MNRRDLLNRFALAGGAGMFLGGATLAQAQIAQPPSADNRGMPPLKITDIKTILTAPARSRLVVVKVLTSEPGLYGLGCATFTQRARVVETAIDKYLRPFLIGKDPLAIEDMWQSMFLSS